MLTDFPLVRSSGLTFLLRTMISSSDITVIIAIAVFAVKLQEFTGFFERALMGQKKYRVGIDVGVNSVGFAAVEIDKDNGGMPIKLLNAQSLIHDGGVDPNSRKSGDSRLAVSGIARRTRRMRKRQKQRLKTLDSVLAGLGYPSIDETFLQNPFEPWVTRADLAQQYIPDEKERREKLTIAIRHIARHRGWRNPYIGIDSLLAKPRYSEQFKQLRSNALKYMVAEDLPSDATPAQIVSAVLAIGDSPTLRLRHRYTPKVHLEGLLPARLMQADNVLELKKIFTIQEVSDDEQKKILRIVFKVISPKGSAEKRVGKDPISGEPRALKASLAFQRYRIADVIGNLRITEQGSRRNRPLMVSEKKIVYDLLTQSGGEFVWADVSDELGITRRQLKGTAELLEDGERVSNRPPRMATVEAIHNLSDKKLGKELVNWWVSAGEADRESMIRLLANTVDIDNVREDQSYGSAIAFIDQLDDEQLSRIDTIKLPSGRAAYSVGTLEKLTERILTTEDDLFAARKHLFNLENTWRPPSPSIGEPVGNPAVDRVLKAVNAYLLAAERKWGKPESVNIEHVRNAFSSIATARQDKRRYMRNQDARANAREELEDKLGSSNLSKSNIRRQEIICRQNSQCLYCGKTLLFNTCEIDHIVPRSGPGSTNNLPNLAAVCPECNRSKSNTLFSLWSQTEAAKSLGVTLRDTIDRVDQFIFSPAVYSAPAQRDFKRQVQGRLKQRIEDPPIDTRSIESVAWMADELRRRIEWHYNSQEFGIEEESSSDGDSKDKAESVEVRVFRGELTSEARKASGIDKQIHFIKAHTKTRLDRRHHAVDAAVIAMMAPGPAQALVIRKQLRVSQEVYGQKVADELEWKKFPYYEETTEKATKKVKAENVDERENKREDTSPYDFWPWIDRMHVLLALLNDALDDNRIVVTTRRRLSLGGSIAHDATVKKFDKRRLGDAIDASTIQKASSPALWCALTRLEDYSEKDGLPEDAQRSISVNGQWFDADDTINFFNSAAAQIAVQGGSADIGSTIHHARIYHCWKYTKSGKRSDFYGMIRVFQTDLLRCAHKDLFTCELKPQSVSMRYGAAQVVSAMQKGRSEYLGYVVEGDEMHIDIANQTGLSQAAKEFIGYFSADAAINPAVVGNWVVEGFYDNSRLRLRPRLLAAEGLEKLRAQLSAAQKVDEARAQELEIPAGVEKILDTPGLVIGVSTLAQYSPQIIRRSTLGEIRWKSRHGLDTSWSIDTSRND